MLEFLIFLINFILDLIYFVSRSAARLHLVDPPSAYHVVLIVCYSFYCVTLLYAREPPRGD